MSNAYKRDVRNISDDKRLGGFIRENGSMLIWSLVIGSLIGVCAFLAFYLGILRI